MHIAERVVFAIRHNKRLENSKWLWNAVRPVYETLSNRAGRSGIVRVMNGTDPVLVLPRWRMISEDYEPKVWRALMQTVRPGDRFADVGSFVGLYAIAIAKRVGPTGKVFAFEPDVTNHESLKNHIRLNEVNDQVEAIKAAVADTEGFANFTSNFDESRISNQIDAVAPDENSVRCVTVDSHFKNDRLDVMKIDVEGYEEKVLQGASAMLSDSDRCPRTIFIEVHPYAWSAIGTTSESLLALLRSHDYEVRDLDGQVVQNIINYGEVIASKNQSSVSDAL